MAFNQIPTAVTILSSLNGWQAISLTNFVTSAQSLIASGSKIEIAGAFFGATTDITPSASSWTAVGTGNTAYIFVIPAGSAGSQSLTAEYTDTAPVWRDGLQGWYLSAGSIMRYVAGVTKTSPTQYDDAFVIAAYQGRMRIQDVLDVAGDVYFGGALKSINSRAQGGTFTAVGGGFTENAVFDALSPVITSGATIIVHGGYVMSANVAVICNAAQRATDGDPIFVYGIRTDTGIAVTLQCDDGDGTQPGLGIDITW